MEMVIWSPEHDNMVTAKILVSSLFQGMWLAMESLSMSCVMLQKLPIRTGLRSLREKMSALIIVVIKGLMFSKQRNFIPWAR